MVGTTFIQYPDAKTLARDSQSVLREQRSVFICADLKRDRIAFSLADDAHGNRMISTVEQARIATELLAFANAHDALSAAEPGLEV